MICKTIPVIANPPKCCEGLVMMPYSGDLKGISGICMQNGCEPVCMNSGTRSEGWYNSCTGKLIKFDNCGGEKICEGCTKEDKCLAYGTRMLDSEKKPIFCDISDNFIEQKVDNETCQNNYECVTNSCASEKCMNLEKELKETRNLIQKFMDFIWSIFNR